MAEPAEQTVGVKVVSAKVEKQATHHKTQDGGFIVLKRFGAAVRARAQRSIKKAKGSRPGGPPASHTGLLKKQILFAVDRENGSVVIGPKQVEGHDRDTLIMLEVGGRTYRVQRDGTRKKVTYKPRPFMEPAYDAAIKDDLPQIISSSGK